MVMEKAKAGPRGVIVRSYIFSDIGVALAALSFAIILLSDFANLGGPWAVLLPFVVLSLLMLVTIVTFPKVIAVGGFGKLKIKRGLLPVIYDLDFTESHTAADRQSIFVSHLNNYFDRTTRYVNVNAFSLGRIRKKAPWFLVRERANAVK